MIIVTNKMFENQFMTGLQQNLQAELTDTQEISSGHKINQPSDDPSALVQIVGYQTQLSGMTEYQKAITSAKVPLQSLDSSLSTLSNTLTRANELAISGVSAANNGSDLKDIAAEVQQLSASALSTANTNINGQYIFAGDKSNVNPIDPNTGEFISDTNSVNLNIGTGVNVTTNVSAGSLFSFQRVNGKADSATAILPTYNWQNSGANTIPDADPVSALETSAGGFSHSSDVLTASGGALNITVGGSASTTPSNGAFVINGTNNSINIDGANYTIAGGIYTGSGLATALSQLAPNVTFSYDATAHSFTITNSDGAAPHTVNFNLAGANNIANIIGFTPTDNEVLSTAGASGASVSSDNAVGDVNLAADSTLQDARDAINTAGAGVKAQVVNVGTSATPDLRLVVASDTAGNSANIDMSVVSGTGGISRLSYDKTTGNFMTLGTNIANYNYITPETANDSIVIDSGTTNNFVINGAGINQNSTIVFNDGSGPTTATIPAGTYTGAGLAAAIQAAINKQEPVNTLTVSYNASNEFNISTTSGAAVGIFLAGSTATAGQLGFASGTNSIPATSSITSAAEVNGTPGPTNGVANNQIVVTVGGTQETATIARGTYTHDQLAAAIETSLNNAAAAAGTTDAYNVTYDPNAQKFTIENNAGNHALDLLWSNASSTAQTLLGYSAVDKNNIAAGASDVSDNSVVANYYSFNNNYLNDKYILRALNFEQVSLQNNDSGRAQQAIKYTTDLSGAVSQIQAQVGAAEDKVNSQSTYQTSSQSDMQVFLSAAQDTDLASVSSDLTLRQSALQALRTVTSDVFSQSLFDFIKPS